MISKEAREAATEEICARFNDDYVRGFAVQSLLDAQKAESDKTITELRAVCVDFRDCVLNGRNQLEAPCLDNDQTNAVLASFDAHFPPPQQGDKAQ